MSCMRALLVCLLVTAAARSEVTIALRDLPGTNGEWQEGEAIIPAPRDQVRAWLVDYKNWPRRFPDVRYTLVLPDDDHGRNVVRFSSRILNADITVHEVVRPDLLVFEGSGPYTHTQGRIHLIDRGDGTTRVLMQSSAEVHGFYKIFATKKLKRQRINQMTASYLTALYNLATRGDRAFDMSRRRE